MDQRHVACGLAALILGMGALVASAQVNLLPNGGFEKDTNGDGVPDGWLADPSHFSRETLDQVQTYIADLPSHEELLESEEVRAFDGWPIARRNEDGNWPAYPQTPEWYRRMSAEYLPQNSRFGRLPVPAGLDLGGTTGIVHNLRPHEQLISEPISVKPNTGYRLSYWFRMSGGSEEALFHILRPDAPRNALETLTEAQILSSISLGWAWVPYWQRYEIPFRTGPDDTAIRLRPWKYYRSYDDTRRAWYDDFRLIEDDSVVMGEIGGPENPEPEWPAEVLERGFALVPRPTLPLTYDRYQPRPDEIDRPVRIAAAPGQTASAVLFVRALKDLQGPLFVGLQGRPQLNGPDGMFIWGGVGGNVRFRVVHPVKLSPNSGQWEMRPHYLMPGPHTKPVGGSEQVSTRGWQLNVPEGTGRSVLVTVEVLPGTPPGEYESAIQVVAPGKDFVGYGASPGPNAGHSVPLVVTVRDLQLLEADVAYGMYTQTARMGWMAPQSRMPYFEDLRRHGMTVTGQITGAVRPYVASNGEQKLDFSAFDSRVAQVAQFGMRSFFFYCGVPSNPYGAGVLPHETQMAMVKRCRERGWPEPLFYVGDEPGGRGAAYAEEINQHYGAARQQGLRTVTSGPDIETQGGAYDIWITHVGGKDWEEEKRRAAEMGAELWVYDCSGYLNTHPRNIRFYTGLWTWAAGAGGNWIWEYANKSAFSLSDAEPPTSWHSLGFAFNIPSGWGSVMAWEARREGVDDYRYLHTLEGAIAAAAKAGKAAAPAVASARKYLADLKARVPIEVFDNKVRSSTSLKQFSALAPDIAPEEYDALQEDCTRHIIAIRKELGA